MAQPRRYLIRMIVFLAAVGVIAIALIGSLSNAFMANPLLNGLIAGVFALGVGYNIRQVLILSPEVAWLETFKRDQPSLSRIPPPRLLAPMATMLGERRNQLKLSALSMRSLLDGIASRLEESRDLSRYTVGLLIFLGLLGTFWGLLLTMESIRGVIGGLTVGSGDVSAIFANIKNGLAAPLGGMGTAFSTSMFGLAGSLVLGFLDLQAGQAQNRFYNDLEDWLSSVTRLSSGALSGEGEQSVPAYVQALLEQSAESLENLQRTLARGEEGRSTANENIMALVSKLQTLTDHMRTQQSLMMRLAESQLELKPILSKLASFAQPATTSLDDATRSHIRNIDVYLGRLIEEMNSGREDTVQQIRSEIKLLARTIAATADDTRR
ncbi:MAG: flagellar motor protein MotA [Rhodospirillales bacterium]|nr:flagellar motor protein MotA [Rhodospirillales bacterium]